MTRFANTAPGFAWAVLGLWVATRPSLEPVGFPVLCFFALSAVWLVVRGYRMAVIVKSGSVTVRGFLWSRTIPRDAVLDLTVLPAIRWRDRRGRRRWSPLVMFVAPAYVVSAVGEHNRATIRSLREALGRTPRH